MNADRKRHRLSHVHESSSATLTDFFTSSGLLANQSHQLGEGWPTNRDLAVRMINLRCLYRDGRAKALDDEGLSISVFVFFGPILAFFARVGGDAAGRNSCPFNTAGCLCRRRTRPFRLREGWGTRICGGFCSLKAGPPAPPTLMFPERTRVALRSRSRA